MESDKSFIGKGGAAMKHTPGPWMARGKSIKGDIDHGKRHTIARADSRGRFLPGYDEANARLMAAAPEMLETLKDLENVLGCLIEEGRIEWCNNAPIVHGKLEDARAAIEKAEGR